MSYHYGRKPILSDMLVSEFVIAAHEFRIDGSRKQFSAVTSERQRAEQQEHRLKNAINLVLGVDLNGVAMDTEAKAQP